MKGKIIISFIIVFSIIAYIVLSYSCKWMILQNIVSLYIKVGRTERGMNRLTRSHKTSCIVVETKECQISAQIIDLLFFFCQMDHLIHSKFNYLDESRIILRQIT
jgi:hypothetical protein